MKLLTVNVHAWLEENQDEKLDILAQTIAEKAYDVIALQEVNQLIASKFVTRELKMDNYGLILLEKLRNYIYYDGVKIVFNKKPLENIVEPNHSAPFRHNSRYLRNRAPVEDYPALSSATLLRKSPAYWMQHSHLSFHSGTQ